MKNFRTLLKSHRTEKQLTQEGLGKLCNPPLSRIHIAQLESGFRAAPPEKTLKRIVKALGLTKKETKEIFSAAQAERIENKLEKWNATKPEDIANFLFASYSKKELRSIYEKIGQKLKPAIS